MKHLILCLCLLISTAAHANPRVIGILGSGTMEKLYRNDSLYLPDPLLSAFMKGDVALYNKPKDPLPLLTVKGRDLYQAHYNKNRSGVLIYGFKRPSWYMVAHGSRAYWIDVLPNMKLHDYYTLAQIRNSFIKQWDWKLYPEAGEGAPEAIAPELFATPYREHPPVEVADKAMVDGELWFRIKLMDSHCYENSRPAKVLRIGWVRAYQPDNERTVWFDLRQCQMSRNIYL